MTEFHEGEITIQTQVDVRNEAERLSRGIGRIIQPKAQEFMEARKMAIASTIDTDNNIWASMLFGQPGFIKARDESTVVITPDAISQNLNRHLIHNNSIGILTIDFARRRRLRINGNAKLLPENQIALETQQVFF